MILSVTAKPCSWVAGFPGWSPHRWTLTKVMGEVAAQYQAQALCFHGIKCHESLMNFWIVDRSGYKHGMEIHSLIGKTALRFHWNDQKNLKNPRFESEIRIRDSIHETYPVGSMSGIYANIFGYIDGQCYHIWHTYGSVMGMALGSPKRLRRRRRSRASRRWHLPRLSPWPLLHGDKFLSINGPTQAITTTWAMKHHP